MRSKWLAPLCCLTFACQALDGKPHEGGRQLGNDLGGFDVSALEQTNSCGEGALGSKSDFKFDVDLSRDSAELFWNNSSSGHVTTDGKFSVTVPVTFPISDPKPPSPGCTMYRQDSVDGTLLFEHDTPKDVLGFSGTMTFDFAPGEGQSCSELIGVSGGFKTLPCSIAYSLDGVRSRDPD